MDISLFFREQQKLLKKVSLATKRYLFAEIDLNRRLTGILGQRGTGKTTLMLQALKEHYKDSDKALYISVDNLYFKTISLYEFAVTFESLGGEMLFIDEVHKYAEWSSHLKAIYDMTGLNVVFSGSSMLQIHAQEADLSRRAIVHRLANLSFREYLALRGVMESEAFSLETILSDHVAVASEIAGRIKPLKYFKEYLRVGCYPFISEGEETYNQKLIGIVNQILETDLPYVEKINFSQIDKIKKLLYILSESVPFVPNISKLSAMTEISRVTMTDYLRYLETASLLNRVATGKKGLGRLKKEEKLYLYNTNLSHAISARPDVGNARETFFVNQLKSFFYRKATLLQDQIALSEAGDFVVSGRYTFEIGGKNKPYDQIKDMEDSFLVADDLEIGFKNKIPLWLFGFLY